MPPTSLRSISLAVFLALSASLACACGDDSVDPSNPDASGAKDASGDGGSGSSEGATATGDAAPDAAVE